MNYERASDDGLYIVYLDLGNQGNTFVASKFALVSFLFVLHCISIPSLVKIRYNLSFTVYAFGRTTFFELTCNRLVINKPKSGCLRMICDSLSMTDPLQVVDRVVTR